jgi:hypothetical protein
MADLYSSNPTINAGALTSGIPASSPVTTLAGLKVYLGGSWIEKPVKVYLGGVWVEKPLKRFNGSSWQ